MYLKFLGEEIGKLVLIILILSFLSCKVIWIFFFMLKLILGVCLLFLSVVLKNWIFFI